MTDIHALLDAYRDAIKARVCGCDECLAKYEPPILAARRAIVDYVEGLTTETETLKHTIVATVGGVDYEGFPTSKINFLQRLRILVEIERRAKEKA